MSVQATFCATLVDEWVAARRHRRRGLSRVALDAARGAARRSDSAPTSASTNAVPAFYALGLAKATRRPVVVCVTSGTAGAELHPAVVEAHHARVPLIVCTADRPPELHHTGASQTIEQDRLFAVEARWCADPGCRPPARRRRGARWRRGPSPSPSTARAARVRCTSIWPSANR